MLILLLKSLKKELDKVNAMQDGPEKTQLLDKLNDLKAQTAPADATKELAVEGVDSTNQLYVMSTAVLKPSGNGQAVVELADFATRYKGATGLELDTSKITVADGKVKVADGFVTPETWDNIKNKDDSVINKPYKITILKGMDKSTDKIAKIAIYRDGSLAIENL